MVVTLSFRNVSSYFLEDILDPINIAKASDYNLSNDLEKIALKMIDWIKILVHPQFYCFF